MKSSCNVTAPYRRLDAYFRLPSRVREAMVDVIAELSYAAIYVLIPIPEVSLRMKYCVILSLLIFPFSKFPSRLPHLTCLSAAEPLQHLPFSSKEL